MNHPIFKNILAIILGWIGGSILNMSLIQLGHIIFPIEEFDSNNMNALVEIMPTLDVTYFIFPFLAHALGTFVGAIIAWLISSNNKMKFALTIGGLFLIGGIVVSYMLPAPIWFTIVDILLAYIPMAWFGGKIAQKINKKASSN